MLRGGTGSVGLRARLVACSMDQTHSLDFCSALDAINGELFCQLQASDWGYAQGVLGSNALRSHGASISNHIGKGGGSVTDGCAV